MILHNLIDRYFSHLCRSIPRCWLARCWRAWMITLVAGAFFTPYAWAQDASAPGGLMSSFSLLVPMVLVFGVFYFLMIRPQQRRMKEHREKINSVRRGDRVLTSGGILGTVVSSGPNNLMVKIADGVEVEVIPSTLSDIVSHKDDKSDKSDRDRDRDTNDTSSNKKTNKKQGKGASKGNAKKKSGESNASREKEQSEMLADTEDEKSTTANATHSDESSHSDGDDSNESNTQNKST